MARAGKKGKPLGDDRPLVRIRKECPVFVIPLYEAVRDESKDLGLDFG